MRERHATIQCLFICLAVVAVFGFFFGMIVFQMNANYQFDHDCIEAGKKIFFETIDGADSAYKVCK